MEDIATLSQYGDDHGTRKLEGDIREMREGEVKPQPPLTIVFQTLDGNPAMKHGLTWESERVADVVLKDKILVLEITKPGTSSIYLLTPENLKKVFDSEVSCLKVGDSVQFKMIEMTYGPFKTPLFYKNF